MPHEPHHPHHDSESHHPHHPHHAAEHPFAHPELQSKKNWLTMPLAVIIAAVIIGGAIMVSNKGTTYTIPKAQVATVPVPMPTETDRRLGNPDSPVTIIEYSDTECPFCKVFHKTMHSVIDFYGKEGTVSWVYRHFPLYKPGTDGRALHALAGKQAEAIECAFEQGGAAGFWKYTDKIYEITPSNNGLALAQLYTTAKDLGFDSAAFRTCLDSDRYADRISRAYDDAVAAGGSGTPYVALISKRKITERIQKKIYAGLMEEIQKNNPNAVLPGDFFTFDGEGYKIVWSGALPVELMKVVIDAVK